MKSIKVDGKVVSFDTSLLSIDSGGVGGAKISTFTPYAVLHSAIYNALAKDFAKRAFDKKMIGLAPLAPFGARFNTKNVATTKNAGPAVPTMDLELRGIGNSSSNTYWRICGANSMARIKRNVMCLGFLDGGPNPVT